MPDSGSVRSWARVADVDESHAAEVSTSVTAREKAFEQENRELE